MQPITSGSGGGGASSQEKTLFWFAILIHILVVLAWTIRIDINFTYYGSTLAFLVLVIWSSLVFKKEGHFINPGQLGLFIFISAFYIFVPFLLGLIPQFDVFGGTNLLHWVSFLLILFPVWPLYIGFKAGIPIASKWVNFWIIFLLIVFIVGIATKVRAGQLAAITGSPQAVEAGGAFDYLTQEVSEIAGTFWKQLNPGQWKSRVINQTGLNYYTGMIDNNEKAPVGLYIDNVRLADKEVYEGYPAIVWADVRGKSFIEEIIVEPSCVIDKVGRGNVNPSRFRVFAEEHLTLSCIFSGLKKGTYRAKVGAAFNFETWAYVTYTFVDLDTKRAIEMQGKNINYDLEIDPYPQAVFTNGPVMLGMASQIDQPVGIDVQNNVREPVLGVTLDSLWTEGKIERVNEFIIQVPEDIELVKCDRWHPDTKRDPFKTEEGYAFYKFSREEIGDPRLNYRSVTCRLHIKDPKTFLAGAQKVQRTFVTQAKYLYVLEKSVSIPVRE